MRARVSCTSGPATSSSEHGNPELVLRPSQRHGCEGLFLHPVGRGAGRWALSMARNWWRANCCHPGSCPASLSNPSAGARGPCSCVARSPTGVQPSGSPSCHSRHHTPCAWSRCHCTSCGMPNNIGVPKMPGAMVMLRMPLRARLPAHWDWSPPDWGVNSEAVETVGKSSAVRNFGTQWIAPMR